jgi:hypothetical protein
LAAIGPAAKDAVPDLITVAQTAPLRIRDVAEYALYSIDPAAAKTAGIAEPVTTYMASVQQDPDVYRARETSIGSGKADGPVVLWINGDPTDFFSGGGTMTGINEWLHPGKNTFSVSGTHHAPVFCLIWPHTGTRGAREIVGAGAFPEPGSRDLAPEMEFTVEHAPQIPERESLSNVPREVLQKEVEQQLKELAALIQAHDGTKAAEMVHAGEASWSKPAYGENDKEIKEEMDEAAKGYSNPQTSAVVTDRPVQLLIGQRSLMAFVEMPAEGKKPAPLLTLKNGKNTSGPAFLLFARMHGKLVIWASPSGVTMSLSQGK